MIHFLRLLINLPVHFTFEIIDKNCLNANSLDAETIVAAPGTSCRHQITEGTQRQALHPVEVLWEALMPSV